MLEVHDWPIIAVILVEFNNLEFLSDLFHHYNFFLPIRFDFAILCFILLRNLG
jgi:hypothetical protein